MTYKPKNAKLKPHLNSLMTESHFVLDKIFLVDHEKKAKSHTILAEIIIITVGPTGSTRHT